MELVKLKALLGIVSEDPTKDIPLQFILDDVEELVRNYCNLEELPTGLTHTCYRMAMDLYRAENIGQEGGALNVASFSEGDTSTSFQSGAEEIKETLLKDYQVQLNRYRRLVW